MSAHTPGPWKTLGDEFSHRPDNPWAKSRFIATHDAKWEDDDPNTGVLESGKLICEMRDGELRNVDLIAAAPELLQATRDFLMIAELYNWKGGAINFARNAVAKAEGKS